MGEAPALRPFRVLALSGWLLVVCELMYRLLVCADTATHQRGMASPNRYTPVGTQKLGDMCPGVDYIMRQILTNQTVLQVNVSDCENNLPQFTARQGVVYGACDDSKTFCKQHVEVPQGMYVSAHVQRLEYWCDTRFWRIKLHSGLFHGSEVGCVECSYHTLEEMFTGSIKNFFFIDSNNSPLVKINIEATERHDLIVNHILEYSGYVIVPYIEWGDFREVLKVPSRHVIMVSVQQSFDLRSCTRMKLTYIKPNTTHQSVERVCFGRAALATVFLTSSLQIQFRGYMSGHSGLKLYFSTLPEKDQPQNVLGGLFNCSVNHYCVFQRHLDCNLNLECEDKRDETEHCFFSGPGCQGLVASRNKCLKVIPIGSLLHMTFAVHKCHAIGGRLASVKTRKEQKDILHIFKNYHFFAVLLGYTSGWDTVPFTYSKFRKWSDNTLIYNLNHFRVFRSYRPSRITMTMYLASMIFDEEIELVITKTRAVLCERQLQSVGVFPSQIACTNLQLHLSTRTKTRQFLFVCLDRHVTHTFLPCANSHCGKATNFQTRMLQNTKFRCDDDITTVHYTLVCDFRKDCTDDSDESFCEHPTCNGFLCSNGQCVLHSQHCNEYSDCLDDSDEVGCKDDHTYYAQVTEAVKKHQILVNLDGTGYLNQKAMNDGQLCPDTHFHCTANRLFCLPVYTRCNGFSDCINGEDEQDCNVVTCPGFYRCRVSKVRVHGDHLCDGWGQCPQRDDELMCDMTCPEGCLCQGHSVLCRSSFSADLFPQLRYLDVKGSGMTLRNFHLNQYLIYLILSHCFLANISGVTLSSLQYIDLSHNKLKTLDIIVILQLPNLKNLRLANNPLSTITSKSFTRIHYRLKAIGFSTTNIEEFSSELYVYLPQVIYLDLSSSGIETIESRGFKNIPKLTELDLRGNPVNNFPMDIFLKLNYLKVIYSSNYRICCEKLLPIQLDQIKCSTPQPVLSSCYHLIPTELHRYFFGLVCTFAVLGNLVCFIATFAAKEILQSKFIALIVHLQFANICMGSHVSIALVANEMFRGKYVLFEKTWTNSVTCKVNGFLSCLSSEVSVWIIWFITLDHITVFCFPGGSLGFNKVSATVACTVTWLSGILLSLIPFLPGLSHWGIHGQSGLCRLALFENFKNQFTWFTVTVVINFILCVMIVIGQAVIQKRTPKYRIALDPAKRSVYSSVHLMRKVAVTDAACWILFGLVRMMASNSVTVLSKIHGTMVVFMLPLNSALNPLLYMWTLATQRKRQAQEERLLELLKSRLAVTEKKVMQ